MRIVKSLGATTLAALLVLGCDGNNVPLAPPSIHAGLITPGSPLPALGDGNPSGEFFQVCKYGSNASFSYSVTNNVTHVTTTSSIDVNNGECWVLVALTNATVSITETSTAAGFQLDHVDLVTSLGAPPVLQPIVTSSGPTVSATIGGLSVGIRGATAKFYNVGIPATGSIGDFVWNDINGNGIQDAGEPGMAGVTVTLGGAASATTTTDANGGYQFNGLAAGNYTVTVGTPAGFSASPSGQGGDPLKDSNGSPASVTLATNSSSDLSVDFGFVEIPPPPSGEIGDFVWNDLNGNGIQDAGEPGLPGLTVTLGGAGSATTTTGANGGYLFSGLAAGSYTVSVGTPSGFSSSPTGAGTPATDNNGSPAFVTLATSSSTDLTIDFGFTPNPPPPPVCTPVSNASNFNGTPIVPGNTIWFNTIFKPKGVPAGGGTINFTASSIAITSGANHYTVSVPNASITFSPSASSASTTFNTVTNTWVTVVPVGYTGNIFLSGAAWSPAGGLPGGANPVTWTGQFTTNMPGFSMQWQWAAAVYTSFGPLASVGAKPIDGNTMNPYANSDHAGTPEAFKGFVTGGARGGGGSNWTGSYSGTVTPPVCLF